MDADFIGNFPKADPNCAGCGKPLLIENAWMTDGCPCNTPLGVNNENETRWRLLMQLQQKQSFAWAELIAAADALLGDVRRRYPGEELRCEFMRGLDAAVTKAKA